MYQALQQQIQEGQLSNTELHLQNHTLTKCQDFKHIKGESATAKLDNLKFNFLVPSSSNK